MWGSSFSYIELPNSHHYSEKNIEKTLSFSCNDIFFAKDVLDGVDQQFRKKIQAVRYIDFDREWAKIRWRFW